jgi:hypothetical protein
MWEAKLNASRALQTGDNESSNTNSASNAPPNNRLPTTGHTKESNVKTEMVITDSKIKQTN